MEGSAMRLGISPGAIGATAISVCAAAVGISLIETMLLRPLAYPDIGALYLVQESQPTEGIDTLPVSAPTFSEWQAGSSAFDLLGGVYYGQVTAAGPGGRVRATVHGVTSEFLEIVGAATRSGRVFEPGATGGHVKVALLTGGGWERLFGRDPSVVGKSLWIQEEPVMVVGVLDGRYSGPYGDVPDLVVPLEQLGIDLTTRTDRRLIVIGRTAPGVSQEQAAAELSVLAAATASLSPATNRGWTARISSLREVAISGYKDQLIAIVVTAGSLVFAGIVTATTLCLSRLLSRAPDIRTMLALGASSAQVVSAVITRDMMPIVLLGGTFGIAGATICVWAIRSIAPAFYFASDRLALTLPSVVAAMAGAAIALILVGLWATYNWHLRALQRGEVFPRGYSRLTSGRLAQTLLGLQVLISVALVIVCGTFLKHTVAVWPLQPGFDADGLFTFRTTRAEGAAVSADYFERVIDAVGATPGVAAVTAIQAAPFDAFMSVATVADHVDAASGTRMPVNYRLVSANYLAALKIPMWDGEDNIDESRVVVISRSVGERLWPGRSAVGSQISIMPVEPTSAQAGSPGALPWRVIGVVGDIQAGERGGAGPATVYLHYAHRQPRSLTIVARLSAPADGTARAVLSAASAVSGGEPIERVATVNEMIARRYAEPVFYAWISMAVAGLAVLLAVLGTYAVVSRAVADRARELAIRVACGAGTLRVCEAIAGRIVATCALGTAVGAVAGYSAMRTLTTFSFADQGQSGKAVAAAAVLSLVASIVAACWPGIRIARMMPSDLLLRRTERYTYFM